MQPLLPSSCGSPNKWSPQERLELEDSNVDCNVGVAAIYYGKEQNDGVQVKIGRDVDLRNHFNSKLQTKGATACRNTQCNCLKILYDSLVCSAIVRYLSWFVWRPSKLKKTHTAALITIELGR